ncbi:DUF2017 domain-containing protein [Williamsia sp. CHRR-6]|uniref:oxidative stress transcriptional regulator AosR n=1 Tax=Williamsia sp. CHRR-6 TaxID=2835871 RepID=UPI001BD9D370|nr:DUF2017 domain-containing protein [Williamsia sp. CHRR-6]MBT0568245.1 DUF2017 domain-containing protein [Williamsia sp. CHRR-6]
MHNWRRRGRGGGLRITTRLDAHEAELIESLIDSMLELLDERSATAPADELSQLTGIEMGHSAPPDDLTLARLLPDFHRPDQDRELIADAVNGDLNAALRSVHEPAILAAKSDAARVVLSTLPPGGGDMTLTPAQAEQWLTAINDVRLALGAMLGIDESTPDRLPPDHPQAAHLDVYHWLTVVQELLVVALMGK